MAEETEPLEVLSVGIEADISALVEGAQTGVEQATAALQKIPPVKIEIDSKSAIRSISALSKVLDESGVSFDQTIDVIKQGMKSTATPIEVLAGDLAKLAGSFDESLGGALVRLHQTGTGVEELTALVSHFQQVVIKGVDDDSVIELSKSFSDLALSAEKAGEIIELGSREGATEVERLAATFAEMKQVPSFGLHFVDLQKSLGLSTELLGETLDYMARLAGTTEPAVHSIYELSNAFLDLPLNAEKANEIIAQGSKESATEVERLAATLAEMSLAPSFGLHFQGLQKSLEISNELLEQTLEHMAGLMGVTPRFDMGSIERFEREMNQLLGIVSRITLSTEDMNQLIQQGMRENATVTERWGAVMAEYLQEELVGTDYSSTTEALGEVISMFWELGGMTPEILQDVANIISLMQQFPGATEGWDLEPQVESLGGVERQLSVVLRAQEFINQATQDGIELQGKTNEGMENLAEILQRASLTQPRFQMEPWYLWEEATNRVASAMSQLESTQASTDRVVQAGTQENADAYSQMAAVVAQVSKQTDLSLDNVVFKMMEMGMISRESGLEIAKVFESAQSPIKQTAEAYFELVTLLHHRPSVAISDAVARSGAEVHVVFNDLRADAESVLELWGLMARAGSVIKVEVEGTDAIRHLDNIQQSMVDASLIGESTTFTLEELAKVPLGPKMAEAVPSLEDVVEGLSKIQLTAEMVGQVFEQRLWGGAHEQAAELVGRAQEFLMGRLGVAAKEMHAGMLAGIEPLQGALEILREMGETGPTALDAVVQSLNEITLSAQQTEVALRFPPVVHEGVANLVKLAGDLGISFGEAGRQLAATGSESAESLKEVFDFLQLIVNAAGDLAGERIMVEGLGRVVEELNQLEVIPIAQEVAIINQGLSEGATAAEKMAGALLELSCIQETLLGEAGERMFGLGTADIDQLQEVLDYLRQLSPQFAATAEEVEAFRVQFFAAADAVGELHMAAAGGAPEPLGAFIDQFVIAEEEVETLGLTVSEALSAIGRGAESGATRVEQNVGRILDGVINQFMTMEESISSLVQQELISEEEGHKALEFMLSLAHTYDIAAQSARSFTASTVAEGELSEHLEQVVQTLDKVTLSAEQAEIALSLSSEVQEGLVSLVNRADELGISLGEAGRQLVTMGAESPEGLQQMAWFLAQLAEFAVPTEGLAEALRDAAKAEEELLAVGVAEELGRLTEHGEAVARSLEDSGDAWNRNVREAAAAKQVLGEVVDIYERFTGLRWVSTQEQQIGLIIKGFSELASPIEAAAAAIVRYSYVMDEGFSESAETMVDYGDVTREMALEVAKFLETSISGYSATKQEMASFIAEVDQMYEGLGRLYEPGQRAAEGFGALREGMEESAALAPEVGRLTEENLVEIAAAARQTTQALEGTVEVFYTLTEQMLHARPAAVIAASMRQMGEEVTLTFNEIEAGGRSMLELLSLGVPTGGEVKFTVDAENAVETLTQVEQALVAANLITQEATHSFEELSAMTTSLGESLSQTELQSVVDRFDQLNLTIGQMNAVLENAEVTGASWAQMVANEMVAASQMLDQSLGEVAQQALKGVGDWESLPIEPGKLQEVLSYLESISAINFGATDQSIASMNKRLAESHAQTVMLRDGLRIVAETHINPSPLRQSIDNIIERLGVLVEQAKQVVYDLTKIGRTPVGLSDKMFMVRLGEVFGEAEPEIKKSVSLINRLRSAVSDLVDRGRTGFQDLTSRIIGTQEALGATQLSAEQLSQIMQAGAEESASSMERLVALVVRLSESSGESFESVVSGMVESGGITKQVGAEVTSVLGQTTGATKGLSGALGSLGSIATGVFGGILGMLGINTLKKLIAKLREATKQTIEYQLALTRLSVGMRAAQRLMGLQVGTIEGWKDQIIELSDVYVNFSRVALTEATSQLIMLTREMRLNEDEMGQVLKSAITLASIYQIDLQQAIRLIVQGMTGMSRGLRRYGVFLSRTALNQEAYNMGLKASWREMDVNERALVALSLITKQTTPMVEDLGVMFSTSAGRIQAATARSEDAKAAIGRLATPLEVIVKESGARFLEWCGNVVTALTEVIIMVSGGLAAWKEFGAALLEGVGIEEASERAKTAAIDLMRSWSEAFALWGPGLADIEEATLGLGDQFDEEAQELLEMAQDYGEQIEDAIQDYHRAVEEAGIKLQEKLEDQARDLEQDLLDAYTDYRHELEDLQREYDRKLEDLVEDNTDKLAELEREYELKRQKLREDHWSKLLKLQEKYQVDSTRLRTRFLETLRDAIAKRDVWAAVKAIRKYRTDRAELKEDYNLKRTQAERDFKLRMAQLERQLAEARRKIIEDEGKSAEELEIWLRRRREELALEYERELEDIHLSNERKRDEFQRAYEDQLEDIETNLQRRLVKIARGMADEEQLTRDGAQTVFDILNSVFGLGGSIDQMMEGFEKRLARRIEIDIAIHEAWKGATGGAPSHDSGPATSWQQGGAMVATHPTVAQFGEVPELVTFTPLTALSKLTQQAQTVGVLQIEVTADDHFSAAFEDQLIHVIGEFVGSVMR